MPDDKEKKVEKTILVVDDEKPIQKLLKEILGSFAEAYNAKIVTVSSAEEALRQFSDPSLKIYVMISDQRMDGMSGTELIKTVSEKHPDTVSIMMTAYSQLEEIEKIIDAGLFAFIRKPWNSTRMVETVERAMKFAEFKANSREAENLLRNDLYIASEFQKVFLKVPIPESSLIDIDLTHRFAHGLFFGGDYYDIFNLGNEKYLFMLGDVAGHGLKASFFTAILKAIIFSEYVKNNDSVSPALFLEWLNRRLYTVLNDTPDLFIAFSACLLDAGERKAVFANAGQPPFMIINRGILSNISEPEIAIGVTEDTVYSESVIELEKNDLIVMCTDGVYPAGKTGPGYSLAEFEKLLEENYSRENDFNTTVLDRLGITGGDNGLFDDDSTILSIRIR